jgi:hypothetical protein
MSPPINDTLTGRAAWAGLGIPATFFTLISAMMHGSHVEARLQGPQGWTGWVTLDVVLAVLPVVVALVPIVSVLLRIQHRLSTFVVGALAIWLSLSMVSCLMAVFWI